MKEIDSEIVLDVLKYLEEKHIQFWTRIEWAGLQPLSSNSIIEHLNDPLNFCLKFNKLTKKDYDDYMDFRMEEFQCRAITTSGKRCRNNIHMFEPINNFIRGYHDRCHVHKEEE